MVKYRVWIGHSQYKDFKSRKLAFKEAKRVFKETRRVITVDSIRKVGNYEKTITLKVLRRQ